MDYYTQLSQKAKERTAKHLQKIAEIEKTLTAAIKNLDSEKSAEKSLSGHIGRLKARSSDFLTDDKMSFERFKKDLRKNMVDLEISQESIRILEGTIIPEKRKQLAGTQKDLILTLRILTTETVAVAEKVIGDLLRQAEAEREKRAKIIAAEGEAQSADKLGEAADIISKHPIALQLRNLQVLSEIAVEKNSTIVFPNQFLSTIKDVKDFLFSEKG